MNKLDKLDISIKETGEEITKEDYESIQKEEYIKKVRRVEYFMENDSSKLSLNEIEFYLSKNNIKKDKINGFKRYHQTNDDYELSLFETGISMKTYYYFKYLIAHYCTIHYTLEFKNKTNMTKDIQIAEKLSLSERQWRNIKSELMKLNLLRVINFEKNKYYKVNPCYVGKQKILTAHTYDAFRDEFIKHNVLDISQIVYWDRFMKEEYLKNYEEKVHKNR